jgi:hypothetical protein
MIVPDDDYFHILHFTAFQSFALVDIKSKVLLPPERLPFPFLAIMFRPFGSLSHQDIYIILLSNILTLGVPDEDHFRNSS